MSSHILMLIDYEAVDLRNQLPAPGTVVTPHQQIQFQVAQHALRDHEVIAHFEGIDSHGNVLPMVTASRSVPTGSVARIEMLGMWARSASSISRRKTSC